MGVICAPSPKHGIVTFMFSVQNWASDRYNCVIIVSSPGKLRVTAHGGLIWFILILCTILSCLGISPNLRLIWSVLVNTLKWNKHKNQLVQIYSYSFLGLKGIILTHRFFYSFVSLFVFLAILYLNIWLYFLVIKLRSR